MKNSGSYTWVITVFAIIEAHISVSKFLFHYILQKNLSRSQIRIPKPLYLKKKGQWRKAGVTFDQFRSKFLRYDLLYIIKAIITYFWSEKSVLAIVPQLSKCLKFEAVWGY